jgi:hypothetical protein
MKNIVWVALFAWFVVYYNGEKASKSFYLLKSCQETARQWSIKYPGISPTCKLF